jgi:hypothetical protein
MMTIIASALFTFWFATLSGLPQKWKLPARPFGCVVCLPVWLSAALYFAPDWVSEATAIVFGSPVVAWLFNNMMKNLKNRSHDFDAR